MIMIIIIIIIIITNNSSAVLALGTHIRVRAGGVQHGPIWAGGGGHLHQGGGRRGRSRRQGGARHPGGRPQVNIH